MSYSGLSRDDQPPQKTQPRGGRRQGLSYCGDRSGRAPHIEQLFFDRAFPRCSRPHFNGWNENSLKVRILGPLDETYASDEEFIGGKSGLMRHAINFNRSVRCQFFVAALPTRHEFEHSSPRIAISDLAPLLT
jgi:hypothetical protein